MTISQKKLYQWAVSGMKKPGLSKGGLAKALGVSPPVITRILNGTRRIQVEEIKKIADYIGEQPPIISVDETESSTQHSASIKLIPVKGRVAAGMWFDQSAFPNGDFELVPAIPGKYEELEQFAFKVCDSSMDLRRIFNGDYVICVPYADARVSMQDGDVVIALRQKNGLAERSCRELKLTKTGYELWSRSTDANHEPVRVLTEKGHLSETEKVEIIGLVIGIFAPLYGS